MVGIVAARDEGFADRVQAASASLRAAYVAAAVRRLRKGRTLKEADRQALISAIQDLQHEATLLQKTNKIDLADEDAFFFAGLTLSVLPGQTSTPNNIDAVEKLNDLAESLQRVLNGPKMDDRQLGGIENLFRKASEAVGTTIGSTGERVDPSPEYVH